MRLLTPLAAVAADGSIWVTDDRNRAILRIARSDKTP